MVVTKKMYEDFEKRMEAAEKKLGDPVGWRVLIYMPKAKEFSKGGIALTEMTKDSMDITGTRGMVIGMGKDCFGDESRFAEPWCKVNEIVDFIQNAGTEVKREERTHRYMNDEDIIGVVKE